LRKEKRIEDRGKRDNPEEEKERSRRDSVRPEKG